MTSPPSKAGPAGHEAATRLSLFPKIISVLVPTSKSIKFSSIESKLIDIKSAVTSEPI